MSKTLTDRKAITQGTCDSNPHLQSELSRAAFDMFRENSYCASSSTYSALRRMMRSYKLLRLFLRG
jgi:hypothetical protein